MLSDDILAEAGRPLDRLSGGAFSSLGADIKDAQRFDIAPGLVISAYAVRQTSFVAQLRALSLCRFPYATTWFEWPGADPVYKPYLVDTTSPTTPAPSRIGVLIRTDETRQRGTMNFAWSHRTTGLSICPLATSFDWREHPDEAPDVERSLLRSQGVSEVEIGRRLTARNRRQPAVPRLDDVSDDDIAEQRRRNGVVWSPYMRSYLEALSKQGSFFGPGSEQWYSWGQDLAGEPSNVRCILLLLNSRNATASEQVIQPEKLNKARTRSGKMPLLNYTSVRVKISRALVERGAASDASTREASRFHLVRGHFKVRRSGVYWWSDHGRGDALRSAVRQGYKVDT